MADFSLRLVLLMREIPREPQFVSTQTLLERLLDAGHEVSLRTVQRDLQALSVHFPLVQNKPQGRGKTGLGWAFAANSQSISFPVMGSAAALTLMLARQHLQSLLPSEVLNHLEPFVQEAQNLLNTQDSGQYRDWFDKVRIAPRQCLAATQGQCRHAGSHLPGTTGKAPVQRHLQRPARTHHSSLRAGTARQRALSDLPFLRL